jgi:hypothetical protein
MSHGGRRARTPPRQEAGRRSRTPPRLLRGAKRSARAAEDIGVLQSARVPAHRRGHSDAVVAVPGIHWPINIAPGRNEIAGLCPARLLHWVAPLKPAACASCLLQVAEGLYELSQKHVSSPPKSPWEVGHGQR